MRRTWISISVICCLAGSAFGLTIEAPKAQIRTIGGPVDGGWNLWSTGEVGEYLDLAAGGRYTVTVNAGGRTAKTEFHLGKEGPSTFTVTLGPAAPS